MATGKRHTINPRTGKVDFAEAQTAPRTGTRPQPTIDPTRALFLSLLDIQTLQDQVLSLQSQIVTLQTEVTELKKAKNGLKELTKKSGTKAK